MLPTRLIGYVVLAFLVAISAVTASRSEISSNVTTLEHHWYLMAKIQFGIETNENETQNSTSPSMHRTKRWVNLAAGCAFGGGVSILGDVIQDKDIQWGQAGYQCLMGMMPGGSGGAIVNGVKGAWWGIKNYYRGKREICWSRKKRSTFKCVLLANAFVQSDKNGNNVLEFSEIGVEEGVSLETANEIIRSKDMNHNGVIDPEEIHPCLVNVTLPRRVKRCTTYSYPVQTYTVTINDW